MNDDHELVKSLMGCRIKTHYGTGGIVCYVSEPRKSAWNDYKEVYTINYLYENGDKSKGIINTIRVKNGIITCEDKPLLILNRVMASQIELF